MKLGPYRLPAIYLLLAFVPASVACELAGVGAGWIFATSGLAVVPLAALLGRSTEELAARAGAGIGALLNATFGNAAELIIAVFALREGLYDVVKASLTGSIIGNLLLVLGLSLLAGGLRYPRQTFNRTAASLGATLLALSAVGLVVHALFHHLSPGPLTIREHYLSLAIAIILFVTYALSLVFSLGTHRHLFAGNIGKAATEEKHTRWSAGAAIILLLIATAAIAFESELLVKSVSATAAAFGLSRIFIGVILVAVIGNAAEHSTAVMAALEDRMDLAIGIAIGSGMQIALFVAPILVFISYLFARPLDLLFTPFEVLAVGLAVGILSLVAQDGESHWMEGVLLLAVYIILAAAFFALPAGG